MTTSYWCKRLFGQRGQRSVHSSAIPTHGYLEKLVVFYPGMYKQVFLLVVSLLSLRTALKCNKASEEALRFWGFPHMTPREVFCQASPSTLLLSCAFLSAVGSLFFRAIQSFKWLQHNTLKHKLTYICRNHVETRLPLRSNKD